MKVALILSAVFCTAALTDHHAGHTNDPCLKQCKATMKTKLEADESLKKYTLDKFKTPEGRTAIRQHMRKWINGTGPIISQVDLEGWTKLCSIATETEACIDQCTSAPADDRDNGKKFLRMFKIGCSPEWKSKALCFSDVYRQRSEACRAECLPQASGLTISWINVMLPNEQVLPHKDVLTSGCKFANCRLNCHKQAVINECGADGYKQDKVFLAFLSTTMKMTFKHFGGDLANWPAECESNKICSDNTSIIKELSFC